jgi:hypothetical protein
VNTFLGVKWFEIEIEKILKFKPSFFLEHKDNIRGT